MPKILILDTYYPEFLRSLPDPVNGDYETELRRVLDRCFGTFDAYSHYLRAEGWEAIDAIANHERLQRRWAMEQGIAAAGLQAIALAQIEAFKPDVVFLQDFSFFDAATLETLSRKYYLAGQCSCPMPRQENVRKLKCIFTSFPHYVERFRAMGVPTVEYLPLAFDPRMLTEESPHKQFDISFVGGVGKRSHWKAGTEMLERVAAEFKERFIWFGYGKENLDAGSPLIPCYAGPAWGRDLYSVYGRSKIVVNRHGEVAEGYSNNLRMFEATGMGALLYTEESPNIAKLFPVGTVGDYVSTPDLVSQLRLEFENENDRAHAAQLGQEHTGENHTYAHRMKVVSDVLTTALVGQAA